MKIVIEIPEERYRRILGGDNDCYLNSAVRNGTPLPKGYGRLIDADKLLEDCRYSETEQEVLAAHTIIEADKVGEEE